MESKFKVGEQVIFKIGHGRDSYTQLGKVTEIIFRKNQAYYFIEYIDDGNSSTKEIGLWESNLEPYKSNLDKNTDDIKKLFEENKEKLSLTDENIGSIINLICDTINSSFSLELLYLLDEREAYLNSKI